MPVIDSALVQFKQLHPHSSAKQIEALEREPAIFDAGRLARQMPVATESRPLCQAAGELL